MNNVKTISYEVNRSQGTVTVTATFNTGGSVQEQMTIKQFRQFKDQLLRQHMKGTM